MAVIDYNLERIDDKALKFHRGNFTLCEIVTFSFKCLSPIRTPA